MQKIVIQTLEIHIDGVLMLQIKVFVYHANNLKVRLFKLILLALANNLLTKQVVIIQDIANSMFKSIPIFANLLVVLTLIFKQIVFK